MRHGLKTIAVGLLAAAACVFACASCSGAVSSGSAIPAEAESFASMPAEASFEASAPEPIWFLILGNDDRAGTVGNPVAYEDRVPFDCRTDTMMLVRIDPSTYLISIVTIPRDTKMYRGEEPWKINTAYYDGYDGVYDQVEALTGVRASHYLEMGFSTFIRFVDDFGGIPIEVAVSTTFADVLAGGSGYVGSGYQTLGGAAALGVARMRMEYAHDADACRQIQDRKLVEGAIRKVLDDPDLLDIALDVFFVYVETDWPRAELEPLVRDFAAHAELVHFQSGTGPYEGGAEDDGGWYATRDEETWAELIRVVEEGGDPTTVVELPVVELG